MSLWEQRCLHALAAAVGACVALSAIYSAYRLNVWIVIVTALIAAVVFYYLSFARRVNPAELKSFAGTTEGRAIFVFCIDLILLALFVSARTDQAIVSPWDQLSWVVFPLYALSSFCLISALSSATARVKMALLVLHGAVTWSMAVFVYALGFGFDPFIHQATESHILRDGFILPKKPFYVGQYVFVTAIAHLTRLPVRWIDELFVPTLAAAVVPFFWWIGLRRGWLKTEPKLGVIALFIIPIASFMYTVPNNFAVVLLVLFVSLFALEDTRLIRTLRLLLAAAAMAVHPLIGIPLALLACARLLPSAVAEKVPRVSFIIFSLLVAGALFGAFGIYAASVHARLALPTLADAYASTRALFASPFDPQAPWPWLWFYRLLRLWPYAMIGVGMWGFETSAFKRPARFLEAAALGCLFAAVLLAVFIRLPGIANQEQFEFPLRLVGLMPIFFLPGMALALERMKPRIILFAFFAVVMAANWYYIYPQNNPSARFMAYGIGKEEVLGVDLIEQYADGKPYAVLSHQMLAAAALRRFGFDRTLSTDDGQQYFYAIPTGGPLYARYLTLIQLFSPQQTLQELFDYAHVSQLFVVIPIGWDPLGWDERVLGAMAKHTFSVGDRLRVYQFVRP